jgi:hypothetical protein
MNSGAGDTTQLVPGFPIRTPWDHSSVDSSPRPIAASHVLHRLLVPRHPPCALSNLTTKMLASTVQFSTNTQPTSPPRRPAPTRALSRHQPGIVVQKKPHQPHRAVLFSQDSTGCLQRQPQPHQPHTVPTTHKHAAVLGKGRPLPTIDSASVSANRAPHHHIRAARAPHPLSRAGAP